MIGMSLMAGSVVAAILIQAFTGRVLEFHTIHTDFVPPSAVAAFDFITFHCRYIVPLGAIFVIGLVCLAWPTRKPPRIISSP